MTNHVSQADAVASVMQAMLHAKIDGKFMVAVWRVGEDGNQVMERTTWQFPTDRFQEAAKLLGDSLREELNPPMPPLPLATFLTKDADGRYDVPAS